MHTYGLEHLNNYFQRSSIYTLQSIFDRFHAPFVSEAEKIQLQYAFLSVIREEHKNGQKAISVSPNGMNFLFCLFENYQYVLLNMDGISVLFENALIFEGELDVWNVQWIEKDNLVTFDLFYIVHSKIQKCICHFSNDSSAFIFFSEFCKVNSEMYMRTHPKEKP